MEYILQTDGLSKVYGTKTVLNHVSIHVPKKSIYGLVGKTGLEKPRWPEYFWESIRRTVAEDRHRERNL